MLYYLGQFKSVWGPFRLFESHMNLIGLGFVLTSILSFILLPRFKHLLPTDRGKEFACEGEKSKGKPQSAGFIFINIFTFVCILVVPPSERMIVPMVVGCIYLTMLTGFFDDKSVIPWGRAKKGILDAIICFLTAIAICQFHVMQIWLPFTKKTFDCPPWLFILIAAAILWIMINSTNCSDGVDALAGTLSIVPLIAMGIFMYVVVGHEDFASYFKIPHSTMGAQWGIMLFAMTGAISGYLWFNAEPSQMLMGDAGSRAIGLALGAAVLASGNFFLGLVVAPVILINGGTGIVKLVVIKVFKRLGVCTENKEDAKLHIKALHKFRFPFHDHCRNKYGWSNAQVLMRFSIVQIWLLAILFALLIKLR